MSACMSYVVSIMVWWIYVITGNNNKSNVSGLSFFLVVVITRLE